MHWLSSPDLRLSQARRPAPRRSLRRADRQGRLRLRFLYLAARRLAAGELARQDGAHLAGLPAMASQDRGTRSSRKIA
jgi:hypothetical protein